MLVKELITLLQQEDPERLVVMSADAEGNSFRPLTELGIGLYLPEHPWYGEVFSEEAVEVEERAKFTPALVLWPV